MAATNLATSDRSCGERTGEVTRETEQTPKPGRRAHSKPGSLGAPAPLAPLKVPAPTKAMTEPAKEPPETGIGRGTGGSAGHCTYLLPVLNCTPTSTLHSTTLWPDPPRHCATEVLCLLCCCACCLAVPLPCPGEGAARASKIRAKQNHVSHAKSCKNCASSTAVLGGTQSLCC